MRDVCLNWQRVKTLHASLLHFRGHSDLCYVNNAILTKMASFVMMQSNIHRINKVSSSLK